MVMMNLNYLYYYVFEIAKTNKQQQNVIAMPRSSQHYTEILQEIKVNSGLSFSL